MLKKMNALQSLGFMSRLSGIRFGPRRGLSLPEDVRRQAEALLGEDLSKVRIFMGPEASRLNVRAFTSGTSIYVAPREYTPESSRWWRLLGHELAHVAQQRRGLVRNPYGYGVAVVKALELEEQAERVGLALQQAWPGAAGGPRQGQEHTGAR